MADLIVAVQFTKNLEQPATGLTLTDINITLESRALSDGTIANVWTDEHPTEEIPGVGFYNRVYSAADTSRYIYYATAHYTGAQVLDSNYVSGVLSEGNLQLDVNVS